MLSAYYQIGAGYLLVNKSETVEITISLVVLYKYVVYTYMFKNCVNIIEKNVTGIPNLEYWAKKITL